MPLNSDQLLSIFFLEKSARVDSAFPPLYTISPINELPKLSIPTTV